MTEQPSEPAREWEYRNFLCRIYQLGQIKVIGYVRVGDQWTQVTETDNVEDDVKTTIERKVDSIIRDAITDDDPLDLPISDPGIDPNPGIDPIDPGPAPHPPNDDPFPPKPRWDTIEYHNTYIPHISTDESALERLRLLSGTPGVEYGADDSNNSGEIIDSLRANRRNL